MDKLSEWEKFQALSFPQKLNAFFSTLVVAAGVIVLKTVIVVVTLRVMGVL